MSEFGYIPEAPEQSFGNNKGIFTPKDIYDLTRADKYTNYGQLELIETKTGSGSATLDFNSIGSYNVHFLTYNNLDTGTNSDYAQIRLSNDSGTSFETSNYQRAVQYGGTNGGFGENRTTSANRFDILSFSNAGTPMNGYVYFYNLGDSTKYSFVTHHSSIGTIYMYFGSQVYTVAETINAIRVFNNSAGNFTSGSISLYGIAES